MSQEPSNTNDSTNIAFADTERPPGSRLPEEKNPDCLICTGKLRYMEPRPGELQTLSSTSEFMLSPGTKPGWHLELTFHGRRRTVTEVWTMCLVLNGRAEMVWRSRPGATRPNEGEPIPNEAGPIQLRSCESTGPDAWREACRTFRTVFGSIPSIRDRNERIAMEPVIKVGSLLVMGEANRVKTTIRLPVAHIAQRYVPET